MSKSVISRHIRNIYQEGELDRGATVAKNATVQTEGARQVRREIEIYNLDAVLSVGYRVNSVRATRFRQWATRILREHLTRGWTLNRQGFEENARELEAALALVRWAAQSQMAELFDTSTDNIGLHLKDIYAEGELEKSATTEEFSVVRRETMCLTLNEQGLTALTLLFAESEPKAKDLMARRVMNLIAEDTSEANDDKASTE